MSEPGRFSNRALIYVIAAICIAASAWQYWISQGLRSYAPDEGIYTLVGWSWLKGDWPYRDVWDHKGPVVFAVPLVRTALLGTASEMTAVQEIVLGGLTALLLAMSAARLWGAHAAALAAVLSVLLWTQLGTTGGHMSTAGSIIGVLNALCVYLGIRAITAEGRARAIACFALGSAGMLCFLAKPNAIGGILAATIVIGWTLRKNWRELARCAGYTAAGLLLPLLITVSIFAAAGALEQMIDVAYLYNARVRGPSILAEIGWLELAKRIARGLLRLNVALITGLTALACVVAFFAARIRKGVAGRLTMSALEFIVPLWLALEIAIYASNGVYGHHVYAVLPAAALSAAFLAVIVHRAWPAARAIPAALLSIVLFSLPVLGTARLERPVGEEVPVERVVAQRIARETGPEDRGLVFARHWGGAVLAHAERKTAVRYFHSPGLYVRGYATNERWDEVAATITDDDGPPAFIVITIWGLKDPPQPAEGPTASWVVNGIDMKANRGPMNDTTDFPSRERVKQLIVQRYDLAFCESVLCVLRPREEMSLQGLRVSHTALRAGPGVAECKPSQGCGVPWLDVY
jgi:hypothetical protein